MKLINYKDKYIKYKNKYLEIKNIIQKGGMDCNNDRVFKNILGTCWMVDILMMICFSDATKNDIESMLIIIKDDIKELIESKRCELESFFPPAYLQIPNREEFLINLLQAFIKRYFAKLGVHTTLPVIAIDPKDNILRCERIMNFNFKHLFSYYKSPDVEGGDLIQQFYFANILGILLLNQNIYFTNYLRKNYKNIIFNPTQDIGIIVNIEKHVCCFFICKGEYKFYNDNDKKIYNCEWNNLLSKLLDNEDLFVVNGKVLNLDRTEFFENIEKYSSYKRINFLTVVSRRDIQGSLNKQIPIYFDDDNKDKIHDFTIVYHIGFKYHNNKNYDKFMEFSKISAYLVYGSAQIQIGKIFEDGIITTKNIDLAYFYYELAFENGENYAALKLGNFYKEKDYKKAIKYLLIAVNSFNTEIKNEAAQILYDIYYNNYKNYKDAIYYKSIFNKKEADTQLEELKEFEKLKKLSDEGFFDLQFDIGLKYLEKDDIDNAILYLNLAYNSKEIKVSTKVAYQLGKIYQKKNNIKKKINIYLNIF